MVRRRCSSGVAREATGRAAGGAIGAPASINTSGVMPVVSLRPGTSRAGLWHAYIGLDPKYLKITKNTIICTKD